VTALFEFDLLLEFLLGWKRWRLVRCMLVSLARDPIEARRIRARGRTGVDPGAIPCE
jgi:hypothetical protein